MIKYNKANIMCQEIIRKNNIIIPKNYFSMLFLCIKNDVVSIALEYLGYLDKYPSIKKYSSKKEGIINNKKLFRKELENFTDDKKILNYSDLKKYDVNIDGEIIAIHIFEINECQPCATLFFTKSDSIDVYWDNILIRKHFSSGISSYTLIFDDRINDLDLYSYIK